MTATREIELQPKQLMLFPRVYVDLDDVIAATLRSFARLAARSFDRQVPFEEISSFDLARSFDLSPAEYTEFMHAAHSPDVLLEDVRPVPRARRTLEAWSRVGAHIAVITGRPISTYDITLQWLVRHKVPFHSLCFVRKYGRNDLAPSVRRPVALRTILKSDFSFAVEDSPKMAQLIVKRMGIPVLFMSKPWNKLPLSCEESPHLNRCRSWQEAGDAGLRLLHGRVRTRPAHERTPSIVESVTTISSDDTLRRRADGTRTSSNASAEKH